MNGSDKPKMKQPRNTLSEGPQGVVGVCPPPLKENESFTAISFGTGHHLDELINRVNHLASLLVDDFPEVGHQEWWNLESSVRTNRTYANQLVEAVQFLINRIES